LGDIPLGEEEGTDHPQPVFLIYLNLCYNNIAGWEEEVKHFSRQGKKSFIPQPAFLILWYN
jgi:hypothetical protein